MNDDTLSGVPVRSSRPNAPTSDSGAADRMTSAGVKRRNCATSTVNTRSTAIAEHEQHRPERGLLALVLAADRHVVADRQRVGRQRRLDVAHGAAEVAALEPGGHGHHLLQVLAEQLRLASARVDRGRRRERHERARVRGQRELADPAEIEAVRVREPHAHVDQAVAAPERGGHLAEQAGPRAGSTPARP